MHLVDQRPDGQRGGVLLVASNEPFRAPAGKTIDVENPCPIALAEAPYGVEPGGDAGTKPASAVMVGGREFDFVVPIINPTSKPLADVRVYLEHVGICDARFRPATWNVGTLRPKDVFYATWRVRGARDQRGVFQASVVVVSRRANPVRLSAPLRLAEVPRPKDEPVRTARPRR